MTKSSAFLFYIDANLNVAVMVADFNDPAMRRSVRDGPLWERCIHSDTPADHIIWDTAERVQAIYREVAKTHNADPDVHALIGLRM